MRTLATRVASRWGGEPAARPRRWFGFFAGFAVALLVIAHGCHTGDHDDEPVFVPVDQGRVEEVGDRK
jgi:hypothetical protein